MIKKFYSALFCLLFIFPFSNTQVFAAELTPSEMKEVSRLQQEYAQLDNTTYNHNNLYLNKPRFKTKFKAGTLVPDYLNSQLAYTNYYRKLFNLTPVKENFQDNIAAQKTAAVLAALDANPMINQHNLPYEKRPKIINKTTWQLARNISSKANLNFNTSDQTAGEVITDLITDRYNLTGADTGHRAWLLSTRLTRTGAGAAYGKNGYRYSVQKVFNPADVFRTPSRETVTYPNSGVFPIELLQGDNIAWSIYLSNKIYTGTPKITITDKDTGRTYQAENVRNYSHTGYGNFETIITYYPGSIPLVLGHEYEVKITGLTSYTFKLFQLQNKSIE